MLWHGEHRAESLILTLRVVPFIKARAPSQKPMARADHFVVAVVSVGFCCLFDFACAWPFGRLTNDLAPHVC